MSKFTSSIANMIKKRSDDAAAANAAFDPNTGLNAAGQSRIEARSGIVAPKYTGARDASGNLRADLTYDPTKSEGFAQLREQALAAPGESPWAKLQMEKQALEQGGAKDAAVANSAQGLAQARALMMRQGGLNSGASARMGMQGAKDLAAAGQSVARQGMEQRLGIQGQDIARKQDLLGNLQTTQLGAQGQNIGMLSGDITNKAKFDADRYQQQMAAWGAEKTAEGQRAAAKGGKK